MANIRVLLDTNIFISREDNRPVPEDLQVLMKTMSAVGVKVLLHPLSLEDVQKDIDSKRKLVSLSKLASYAHLDSPPSSENDAPFLSIVGVPKKHNDKVDNELLYAVYRNAVHLIVTEDAGIKSKALRLGIADRVLTIDEAQPVFSKMLPIDSYEAPPLIQKCPVHNIEIDDSFFQELKRDYDDFESWFQRISQEGRGCYIYLNDGGKIGALLILKNECESIDSDPPLPAARRLKICLFKVEETGLRLGELFIKIAVQSARENGIDELYLTHISEGPADQLETLIKTYGFEANWTLERQDVWLKKLVVSRDDLSEVPPAEVSAIWPSFCDAPNVQKIIVPIQPFWHDRLFIDFPDREQNLFDRYEFIIEGNAIEKAYLSHSPLKRVEPGAILLFYRSHDMHALTTLGIVRKAYIGLQDPADILRIVKKRTVYQESEIVEMAKKPLTVILFTWNCYLSRPIYLDELKNSNILRSAPQSMNVISHEVYEDILQRGVIDECFAVH